MVIISMNKKKKVFLALVIGIVLCGLFALLGTYALWQVTEKQTNQNKLASACLEITYGNETGEFYLEDAWPKTDAEGIEQTPYTFSITNNCDNKINYEVYLESIKNPNQGNVSDENYYLANNYVRVTFDDSEPTSYNKLQTATNDNPTGYTVRETKKLMSRSLLGNETKKHKITFWVDENTPLNNSDGTTNTNRYFGAKIKVVAGQSKGSECYAIDTDGLLLNYDWECGPSVHVPATVNNIPVTRIGYYTFKTTMGPSFLYLTDALTPEQLKYENIYFGIGVSERAIIAYNAGDMQTLTQLTSDEIAYVSYKDEDVDKIEEAITGIMNGTISVANDSIAKAVKDLSVAYNIDINDTIYSSKSDDMPKMGVYELYTIIDVNGVDTPVRIANYNDSELTDYYQYRVRIPDKDDWNPFANLWDIDLSHATNLTTIDDEAFINCLSRNPLDIPANVTSIGQRGLWHYGGTVTVHNQNIYNTKDAWMHDSHLVNLGN